MNIFFFYYILHNLCFVNARSQCLSTPRTTEAIIGIDINVIYSLFLEDLFENKKYKYMYIFIYFSFNFFVT